MAMADTGVRIERDSMGEMGVPTGALYGASTQRAVLNFPVSGRPVPAAIIRAFAMLKAACARTNHALGRLDASRAKAIEQACYSIESGLSDHGGLGVQFPVDIFQTGSGTSTNMNANEVIANLICLQRGEAIGRTKDADYLEAGGVHPNDHVNMGQSSNDTFPTAMHIATAVELRERLVPALRDLAVALEAKAKAWDGIVKIGRTHLQDATPIRVGQEFAGYARQARLGVERAERAIQALTELALGGTAVGTGINTHPKFGSMVAADLAKRTGIAFVEAVDHCEAQHAKDGFVEASGVVRTVAVSLSKIAGDIRLLSSGPRCGIGELILPAVQPGSSIMPGKVNPVICESVIMVCCQVLGNDQATTLGGLGGIGSLLDLNVAMPMMGANLLDSVDLLTNATVMLRVNAIEGLGVNEERCAALIEGSLAMCTSLAPVIGYDAAAGLAKEAFKTGKTVRQVALEKQVLPEAELARLLDPATMTRPDAE
jgi:fumarate hydratase, class II